MSQDEECETGTMATVRILVAKAVWFYNIQFKLFKLVLIINLPVIIFY